MKHVMVKRQPRKEVKGDVAECNCGWWGRPENYHLDLSNNLVCPRCEAEVKIDEGQK